MGMKIKMGYVSPAAQQAARKAAQAKRIALNQEIDRRTSQKLASLIDAATSKATRPLQSESRADEFATFVSSAIFDGCSYLTKARREYETSGIFQSLPRGIDRPDQYKSLRYRIVATEARGEIENNVGIDLGEMIPEAKIHAYGRERKRLSKMISALSAMGAQPIFFVVRPIRDNAGKLVGDDPLMPLADADASFIRENSGFGVLDESFVTDDPKFLAHDLARVQIKLAEKNLKLSLVRSLDFFRESMTVEVLDLDASNREDAEPFAKDIPPFVADGPVIVQMRLKNSVEIISAPLCLRPGDRILASDASAWRETRDKMRWLRKELSRADAEVKERIAQKATKADTRKVRSQEEMFVKMLQALDLEMFKRGYVLPDAWASLNHGNNFALLRNEREVGQVYLPFMFDEAQIAHLCYRLGALGLEMKIRV